MKRCLHSFLVGALSFASVYATEKTLPEPKKTDEEIYFECLASCQKAVFPDLVVTSSNSQKLQKEKYCYKACLARYKTALQAELLKQHPPRVEVEAHCATYSDNSFRE